MESVIPLDDLPQAEWVVASTAIDPQAAKTYTMEYPLAYRAGFADVLTDHEVASIGEHLKQCTYAAAMIAAKVDENDVHTIIEITVSDPNMHRAALREIKELLRPKCPFTALLVVSFIKMSGNTGKVWVGIRDYVTISDRERIAEELVRHRRIHNVQLRGASSLELRVDWQLARQPKLLTPLLVSTGVYPDFMTGGRLQEFEYAFAPGAGF